MKKKYTITSKVWLTIAGVFLVLGFFIPAFITGAVFAFIAATIVYHKGKKKLN